MLGSVRGLRDLFAFERCSETVGQFEHGRLVVGLRPVDGRRLDVERLVLAQVEFCPVLTCGPYFRKKPVEMNEFLFLHRRAVLPTQGL